MPLQEFIDIFYDKKELSQIKLPNLPEKCAKSFSANGFLLFNENNKIKHLITDLVWFAKVMNFIISKPDSQVNLLPLEIGNLWELNRLKESLKKYLPNDSIQSFISYLIDSNLVVKIEYEATQSTFILPTSNIPEQPLDSLVSLKFLINWSLLKTNYCYLKETYWSKEWLGHAAQITYSLNSQFNLNAFVEFLKQADSKNIVLIWNQGVLLRHHGCSVLLIASNTECKKQLKFI
jgi:hypothetical protein